MIHYFACPVCSSSDIKESLSAKDFTVSQQQFSIWHCNNCTFRFTQDIPSPDGIGRYYQSENYISHSDTKKGLVNRLYHIVRKKTLSSKRKLVVTQTKKNSGKILDIGCGTGAFLHTMKLADWQITGIEPDDIARKKAIELYGIQANTPINLFNLVSKSYDAITLWHVLEHVHDLKSYLKQVASLLAKEGKLFIAVPNYTSHDASVYQGSWAAYDVPRHLYHFSPGSMKILVEYFHLKIIAIKPMWYDSFYVSMLSEKYKSGKGNLLKAVWNGFVSNCKAIPDKKKCSSLIYIIGHDALLNKG
jgi:SAM-dependent methyltransferase